MKCYKCGKEGPLKRGICVDCYKEILRNRYKKKKKSSSKSNFILNNIERNERIISKIDTSGIIYFIILALFSISIILFPKTIMEFTIFNKKFYFLLLLSNIFLFSLGIYLTLYYASRDIYLTNKKIIGKWGLFKIKTLIVPLNDIVSIETYDYTGLELDTKNKLLFFDFVKNNNSFKQLTIIQIQKIINSTDNEKILMSFSHSILEKIDNYNTEQKNSKMLNCPCCNQLISKNSITCLKCGEPIIKNTRSADFFVKALCFSFPPIGIILFLLNIGPYPKFAKECLLSTVFSLFLLLLIYLSLLSII